MTSARSSAFRTNIQEHMTDLHLRHGKLIGLRSEAVLSSDWSFVVASIKLEGDVFYPSSPLAHYVDSLWIDAQPAELLSRGLDAIWVRARLKSIFGVDSTPENERIEKSLSSYAFVAVKDDDDDGVSLAIPFDCEDYYGKTRLCFSPHETDSELMESVAYDFWWLLTRGVDLADYEDRAFHLGASIWMVYGCKEGKAFYYEEEPDEEDFESDTIGDEIG